ncbi:MAG: glycosyltransferase family 39 protein [Acidobacteria bacterium]|nr:glycosyltransferase family 39 protein [Acidobacteriota bacterium]
MTSSGTQMPGTPIAAAGGAPAAPAAKTLAAAAAAAASFAIAFAASPVTIVSALLAAALLLWAARDLTAPERRWFLRLSGTAIALRFAVTALLPLMALRSGAPYAAWFGDGYYNIERSIWLRDIFLGIPLAPFDYFEAFHAVYGRTRYQFLLAFVHLLFGRSPFAAHLVSVVLYTGAVVVLFRLAKRAYGTAPAMLALVPLWFMPSLFAWSVSAMKEAEMVCLGAAVLAATLGLIRSRAWPARLLSAAVLIIAMAALDGLRAGALPIVVGGLAAGLLLRAVTRRSWALLAVLAAAPAALWMAPSVPGIAARAGDLVRTAAHRHIGYVWTPGETYRVLDEHFYNYDDVEEIRLAQPGAISRMTHPEMLRFLVRSAISFFLVPEVWKPSGERIRWLFPQQVVWYAALLLAVPGALAGWRRDPLVTSLLLGSIAAGAAIIAPNSGNVATLIRHRDMVSPFVFVLAAVGACRAVRAVARRGPAWR